MVVRFDCRREMDVLQEVVLTVNKMCDRIIEKKIQSVADYIFCGKIL